MKVFKKILFFLVGVLILGSTGIYIYLLSTKPQYSGEIKLKGLKEKVDVYFDNYGIPHIYASNDEDAYFALGYVHAQDRLFQMEILRRLGSGRLAEILGKDLTKVDAFFRTLGTAETAKQSAKEFLSDNKEPYQKGALAYMEGVNSFIEKGKTPVEFTLLQIPKEKFTPEDFYYITGFMAFNFAEALKNDPVLTKILKQYGKEYVNDISPLPRLTNVNTDSLFDSDKIAFTVNEILNTIPVPPFIGSNGWAVAPSKSKSGKVLFANDTHIGYGQPSVWYEAHLEYPGYSFYGNFLGGFPYALTGHTKKYAWGLTMLENDDMDLFREKQNPENENQYWANGNWIDYETRNETIKVKGASDSTFQVKITRHGPVINSAVDIVGKNETSPVAVWWTYTKFPATTLQVVYQINHAASMDEFRNACKQINAPGLNVVYGDADGNIALWACAKMAKRLSYVNSKLFLDGASGNDDPPGDGYFSFEENPHSENPACGFVFTANYYPDSITKNNFPGYYAPPDRSDRIYKFLNSEETFSVEDMYTLQAEAISDVQKEIAIEIILVLKDNPVLKKSALHESAAGVLKSWDGNHRLTDVAPTIQYKLLSYILQLGMEDEMGKDDFAPFQTSHTLKNAYLSLMKNDSSKWWDNVETKNKIETRTEIFATAFSKTIDDLKKQFGSDISKWAWANVHTTEHIHLIGRKKPFDKIFNVGPYPSPGGSETVNAAGFPLNTNGEYKTSYGPALRTVIDFADIENATNTLPTGQSGNFMSSHYNDQAQTYLKCQSHKMMMNPKEIKMTSKNNLVMIPGE
ncbi:MAG: penicillin acylase family protein [Bacteroidia bacterium]